MIASRPSQAHAAQLAELDVASIWHPLTQHSVFEKAPPKFIEHADGSYLYDAEGKKYLDAVSGLWCVNIGHGRKELAAVAAEQMTKLAYLPMTMSHEPAVRLADKLLKLLDFEGKVYFSCSGSEANEAAFKMARQYFALKGQRRFKIIARQRAYHGNTLGALSATGQPARKQDYEPLLPGVSHVPPPYCYRCPFGKTFGACELECASAFEQAILHEGPETVAAVIVEPVVAGGGAIISPEGYLKKLRNICDRHGVLLIFDEVVTGFGRTGRMFGHQHWGVKPDMVTLAKGIASGYQPLAATVVQQPIFEAFLDKPGTNSHFRHVNTYGGHPVATAVGLKNIEILEEENLVERVERVGHDLAGRFRDLLAHPLVGDIRAQGLLIGLELVSDKLTKEPLEAAKVVAVVKHCFQNGVIIGRNADTVPEYSNVLIVAPPFVLKEREADELVASIESALDAIAS